MKTVDVGSLLDTGQWSGYQKLLVGVTALTIVVDGFDNQLLAIAILPLMREWDVPRAAFASILASGMVGMMVGGAMGGYIGDRVGRRTALLASVALFGVLTALVSVAGALLGALIMPRVGSFFVRTSNSAGYVDRLFNSGVNVICPSCQVSTAGGTLVDVTQGVTHNGIDFALAQGGRISGMVTDAATSAPLVLQNVQIYSSTGTFLANARTSEGLAGVAAGSYFAVTTNTAGYINQAYPNTPRIVYCPPSATTGGSPIAIAQGTTTGNIDFSLNRGGRISGVVRAADSTPLPTAHVILYADTVANCSSSGGTNSLGRYVTAAGAPEGVYKALATSDLGFLSQTIENVVVSTAVTTAGVDFTLDLDPDPDGDGITASIDVDPGFSNDFSDAATGGVTSGTIVDRAGWTVRVALKATLGIRVSVSNQPSPTPNPVVVSVCPQGEAEEV